jgi:hypothetical protein
MADGSVSNDRRRVKRPLHIMFSDGMAGQVNLSASFQVKPGHAPYLIAQFGNYEQAEARLVAVIESVAFAELESCTSREVRRSRLKTGEAILQLARTKAAEIGFTLQTIELREISQIDERGHSMEKIKILFVSSNPERMPHLKLDEEVREIQTKLRAAEYRDSLELITKWAARPDDLLQSLNEHKPHIVHFSGHGSPTEEIILLDEQGNPKPVSKAALVSLFHTLTELLQI